MKRRKNQVTLTGLLFFAISAIVLTAAINSASNVLFIVFGFMAGVIVASAFLTRLSLRRLKISRSLPDHVVAGEPAEIEFTLQNQKRFWPCFAARVEELDAPGSSVAPAAFFLHVPPRSSATAFARLVAPRRGLLSLSAVRLRCAFPLGILARYRYLQLPGQLVVYPRVGTLHRKIALACREAVEAGTMTSNRRGGNDEFYGLREYRPGDNIRAIHWRSTARTHQLMVRELTANTPPQMIVLLNLRTWRDAPDGREKVERAIELAATVACDGFLENFAVALAIPGIDTLPPAPLMGRGARSALLRRLAVVDPDSLNPGLPLPFPTRLAGRAEWIVINLRRADPYKDLLAGSAASRATLLALDDPEAASYIHYLSPADTTKLLREPQ
jgi:uncharacterized protein (DUF58 family)